MAGAGQLAVMKGRRHTPALQLQSQDSSRVSLAQSLLQLPKVAGVGEGSFCHQGRTSEAERKEVPAPPL